MDGARARELLAAQRARIERSLSELAPAGGGDGSESDELDQTNRGAELEQDELSEGLADDLREQLAAVERAEQRLDAGTYGLSIKSGEPIPDERLEILPTAELTVAEEAWLEGHGSGA